MNDVAAKLFETQTVTDANGAVYPLHSHTSLEQCEFLQGIIKEINAKTSLEVGLAYGVSALFICEALQKQEGARHYVIDPRQSFWNDVGLKNLMDAGYEDLVDFRRDYSHNVLPELHRSGVTLDFAYVDTTKLFDVVLVDVYYIIRMLRLGGILVLDDCSFPSLRKLVRFLAVHPSMRVFKSFGASRVRWQVKVLSPLCKMLPKASGVFAPDIANPDAALKVNARCIAFQKISEDSREWNWFAEF